MRFKKGGGTVSDKKINEHIIIPKSSSPNDNFLYDKIFDIFLHIDDVDKSTIITFLKTLSADEGRPFFNDIQTIVKHYDKDDCNFQTKYFDGNDLFSKYNLSTKENKQNFITIDPSIIQIMIFDTYNRENNDDIVFSFKLIIRESSELTLRYTTKLFPENSKIGDFQNLTGFNNFNTSLDNNETRTAYNKQLLKFLKKYIKFYQFYKKCYTIQEICNKQMDEYQNNRLIDYQLKYISILGKARFGNSDIIQKTALLTDYVMSNLIFTSPTYAFISGGYKGFKSNKFGITRSGYEIAKKYNRPILTIMCKEGMVDAHEYSDATLIYGEHWGEDTIALSQLTDGAIVIAPFGGWTYIECLALLANKKIVGIYNDLFNILNYEKPVDHSEKVPKISIDEVKKVLPNLTDDEIIALIIKKNKNKSNNKNFFNFFPTEQNSIIDYYINYYLILLHIITVTEETITEKIDFTSFLTYGIQILMYLKTLFSDEKILCNNDLPFSENFIVLINIFNQLKTTINTCVDENFDIINNIYSSKCSADEYQRKIPKKCDGIWIKPVFNLIEKCIRDTSNTLDDEILLDKVKKYVINLKELAAHIIFKNLNNNIIFVFSDVMYLNMYLNANLNTTSFQQVIHKKIDNLSVIQINHKSTTKSMKDLTKNEARKLINLDRNMDGMYDTEQGKIINDTIIREKYSFIINESCNEYTSMLLPVLNKQTTEPVTLAATKQSKKQSKQSKQSKK